MNRDNLRFIEVLKLCEHVDELAVAIYNDFAANCSNRCLKQKWMACAEDEKEHVKFWRKACRLAKKTELPEILENSEGVKKSLQTGLERLNRIHNEWKNEPDPKNCLLIAYQLEAFMLDPEMMAMLHFFASSVERNIPRKYGDHINRFIEMFEKYSNDLSLSLLGETLGKLYRKNIELAVQNTIDPLSGILNRRGFFNSVAPFLNLARREKSLVGIIMGDIDDFKMINESQGHPKGDVVITCVAKILTDSIRKSDICGRYGGEEFIVFLNLKKGASLDLICRRIKNEIKANIKPISGLEATISLGAAAGYIKDSEEKDLAQIIENADQNLLKAKKNGKDCWVV